MIKFGYALSLIPATMCWLIPNHYPPWSSFYQNFLVSLSFLYLFFLISTQTKNILINKKSLYLIILILIFHFKNIVFFGDSVVFGYYLIFITITITTSYSFFSSSNNIKFIFYIVTAFVVWSILSLWIALRQWLLLSGSVWIVDLEANARPFANLGQPNNLSTLLCIGLACIIYLYEKNIIGSTTSSIVTLFLLAGVVITQSRTPWLACIAVLIFWTWKYYTVPNKLQLTPLVLLSWCIVFAVITLAFPLFADLLFLKGQDLANRAQSFERWELYTQFYHAILQGPIWGYGVGQISAAQVAITPDYPVQMMSFYTHNIILDILIWYGPVIGGVIVILCGIWLFRLGLHAKSTESLFALVAAGFILTHSMLEYPHAYAYFLLPLGLFLGIAQTDIPNQKTFEVSRRAFHYFIGLLTILGGWIAYEYIIIEEDFRLMRFETANIGTIKADEKAPDVILLTQLRDYTRFARTPPVANMSDIELDWMRKVAHRYPYATSLSRYIYALALNNKLSEAQHQLIILKGLHKPEYYIIAVSGLRYYADENPHITTFINSLELPSEQ